jgi:imidazolonepropionase-like amidohydrolase
MKLKKNLISKFRSVIFMIVFTLLSNHFYSQDPVYADEIILIEGATIHTGTGQVIENGSIVMNRDKLVYVGYSAGAKTFLFTKKLDATNKQIYPGFIAPNATIGLSEIDAVRATLDFKEVGNFNPHIRTLTSYNTDSEIIPTVRSNGILMAQITPRGGRISGTSSIMTLNGWNWEDAQYKIDDGIHLNWPQFISYKNETSKVEVSENYVDEVSELELFFSQSLSYSKIEFPTQKDSKFEAMRGVFNGSKTLFVHTNFIKDIIAAVNFKKEFNIEKMVLVGGDDAWQVADLLRENNIPLMIGRIHSLPKYTEDDIDLPYKMAKILFDKGVLFCLQNEGDQEAMNARNIPFLAGTACAYGLSREEAIKSITLNTAKILGIDKTTGSLETGKDATFFISNGDALDMMSNNVEHAFIKGVEIDLNTRQKDLYQKYKTKYKLN